MTITMQKSKFLRSGRIFPLNLHIRAKNRKMITKERIRFRLLCKKRMYAKKTQNRYNTDYDRIGFNCGRFCFADFPPD